MTQPEPTAPLKVAVITSSMFSENCYLAQLPGRSECVVFDPGFDSDEILGYLAREQLVPAAILNTHGHADHIVGNEALKQSFPNAPLVIGAGDADKLRDPMGNRSGVYGFPLVSPPADRTVVEGERISAAGLELEVLETPGHSIGHVVFLWKGASPWIVFGGDVLFAGGIGRTDFPDGDHRQLVHSIRHKLFTLPDDTIVLPGHGPATTIGEEKESNPFVGRAH